MRSKWMVMSGVVLMALTLLLPGAYANHGGWDKGGYGHKDKGHGDMSSLFFKKAHIILENKKDLGLADDKVEAIKALKIDTEKANIRQEAEVKVLEIDIQNKLREYPVDVDAVNKLVDQKYELKKTGTKGMVVAFAKLKATLSQEQYDKLHALMENKEHEKGCSGGSC